MRQRTVLTGAAAVLACVLLAACGGSSDSGNPNSPSGSSGSSSAGCSGIGAQVGTITATIGGAAFSGCVPKPYAIYTPIAAVPSLGLDAQDFIIVQGLSADLLTSFIITARAQTGTVAFGQDANGKPATDPKTGQPLVHNATVAVRANGALSGQWTTDLNGGSGTITITAVSKTAASGTFSMTMTPRGGPNASGNKAVTNGSFSTTF